MVNRILTQELEERNLLSINQHAFRGAKGTETYFAEHNELFETHYPKGHHNDCAVLDLSTYLLIRRYNP